MNLYIYSFVCVWQFVFVHTIEWDVIAVYVEWRIGEKTTAISCWTYVWTKHSRAQFTLDDVTCPLFELIDNLLVWTKKKKLSARSKIAEFGMIFVDKNTFVLMMTLNGTTSDDSGKLYTLIEFHWQSLQHEFFVSEYVNWKAIQSEGYFGFREKIDACSYLNCVAFIRIMFRDDLLEVVSYCSF